MWIMLVTVLYYSDPLTGHFSPALGSVEFKSKGSCENARTAYLAQLTPIAKKLNDAIELNAELGKLQPPSGVVISAICVVK